MRRLSLVLVVAFGLITRMGAAAGAPKRGRVLWRWSHPGVEIFSPSFSRDGRLLTFVRQAHWPQGAELDSLGDAVLQHFQAWRKKKPRCADPQVVVAAIGQGKPRRIGYGWEPAIAPDGKSVVFVVQKKPVSGQRVPLAPSALEGNYLARCPLATHQVKVLVRPSTGYLSTPVLSASGSEAAYLRCLEVAPRFAAGIAVGEVGVTTRKARSLLLPERLHGFYRIAMRPVWSAGRFLALRVSPGPLGKKRERLFTFDLMSLEKKPRLVYSWGARPGNFSPTYGATVGGTIVLYDKGWMKLSLKKGASPHPLAAQETGPGGVISPNGLFVASVAKERVMVGAVGKQMSPLPLTLTGFPLGVAWAPDSRRLAVVTAHFKSDKVFDYDELLVVQAR